MKERFELPKLWFNGFIKELEASLTFLSLLSNNSTVCSVQQIVIKSLTKERFICSFQIHCTALYCSSFFYNSPLYPSHGWRSVMSIENSDFLISLWNTERKTPATQIIFNRHCYLWKWSKQTRSRVIGVLSSKTLS